MRVTLFLAFVAFAPAAESAQLKDGQPLSLPEARKLLVDSNPQVRLRGALVLTAQFDEQAIGVLIDLLAELPANDRRQAEQALRQLAGDWSPNPPLPGEDELSRKIRREVWVGWWRTMDGPRLLAAFRQRTLSKQEAVAVQALINQLGDKSAAKREKAGAELIGLGDKVTGLLRAAKPADAEQERLIAACSKEIAQNGGRSKLPLSAPCLLATRKPAGAAEVLLAYLPNSDDRLMKDEIIKSLKHLLLAAEKPSPAVLQALTDPLPLRRMVAAEALVGASGAKHWPIVRPLLKDADRDVRLHVAVALVNAQDKEAVPALIALLAELPRGQAWEAEELLQRLAGAKAPAVPWSADDAAARKKLSDAWQAWWMQHGAAVNLADLEKTQGSSGLTLVAQADAIGPKRPGKLAALNGKVVALDRTGQVRWQIDNLDHPIDVRLLPGERVLIAEFYGKRVTERDFTGKILWEINLPTYAVNAQRLANGNTFIALYGTPFGAGNAQQSLMEVDPTGKTVASFAVPAGPAGGPPGGPPGRLSDMVLAAHKMADGKMVCLMYDESCVWLDATGKELKRFPVPRTKSVGSLLNTYGNIDVTPKGHVLFAHSDGTVMEYDADGKVVGQLKANGYRATRLINGNTLVALQTGGVVELDAAGRTVWQYDPPSGQQAIRARR